MARFNTYKLQFKNKYVSSIKHCTKHFIVPNILFNHYKNNCVGTFYGIYCTQEEIREITDEIICPKSHGQVVKLGLDLKSDEYQS